MARREVGESVGSADGLDVVHVALAAKVARRRQVDFEGELALIAVSVTFRFKLCYTNFDFSRLL